MIINQAPFSDELMFQRILLKISGEVLRGASSHFIDSQILEQLVLDIAQAYEKGIKLCLVIGGGNIVRGAKAASPHLARETADLMGMLATVMNGLAMASALQSKNIPAKVVSALHMPQVCTTYEYQDCLAEVDKNQILIFAAGSGNPYFTTDTVAILRALEMKCDVIMKGTQVDGVYSDDPRLNAQAEHLTTLDYQEVLTHNLRVMDMTAITLAQENQIPILIFNLCKKGGLLEALKGRGKYTLIQKEKK